MKNRDIKIKLFNTNLFYDINSQYEDLYLYCKSANFDNISIMKELHKSFYYSCSDLELESFLQIKNSNMNTKRNIKQFIQFYYIMNSVRLVFATLTFNDDCLAWSYDYRRKKIISYCKNTFIDYIGNVDFGHDNHREHYHIIGVIPNSKYIKMFSSGEKFVLDCYYSPYNYGLCHFEHVYSDCSYYVTKLTNHALKYDTAYKGSKSILTTKSEFYRFKKSDLYKNCILNGNIAYNRPICVLDFEYKEYTVREILQKKYCTKTYS